MISVKSSVQAVDPACGIWLVGEVLGEREDAFNIRWANYRVTDWVAKDKVRVPVPKRHCRLDTNDWPLTQPSLLQKGEGVYIKKADGTSGESITVEENDPFNCLVSIIISYNSQFHLPEVFALGPTRPQTNSNPSQVASMLTRPQVRIHYPLFTD